MAVDRKSKGDFESQLDKQNRRAITWIAGLFAFLLITISIISVSVYVNQIQRLTKEKISELTSIADSKVSEITSWRNERLGDAEAIHNNTLIAVSVQALLADPENRALQLQNLAWMEAVRSAYSYQSYLLLDGNGNVELQDPLYRETLAQETHTLSQKALSEDKVILSDLYRPDNSPTIHMDLYIPIHDPSSKSGKPIALFLLHIDPYQYLYPLIQSWPVPSQSGETLLIRRDGDFVTFLNSLRFLEGSALQLQFPVSNPDLPAAKVVRGEKEELEGTDYRGVKVVYVGKQVPDTNWFLLAKIDKAEIFADVRKQGWILAVILALVLTTDLALAYALIRRQRMLYTQELLALEQERQEIKERYSLLLEAGNDIIFVFNEQGLITDFNDRAVEAYGYETGELRGMSMMTLRTPDYRQPEAKFLNKVKKEGNLRFELDHQRKDGQTFSVEESIRPFEVTGQGFYLDIVRDTSERARLLKRLQLQFESMPVGFLLTDDKLNILDWNPAAEKIFGYSREEMIGRSEYFTIIPADQELVVREEVRSAIAENTTIIGINENLTKDGRRIMVEWHNTPLRDDTGKLIAMMDMAIDVTERQQTEKALAESEMRYRGLFTNMLNGMAYCKMIYKNNKPDDFIYLEVNNGFGQLTGLKEVIGKKVSEVIPGIKKDNPELFKIYGRVATTGNPESFDTFLAALDIYLVVHVYSPEKGYFVAIFENITDRKQAEIEINKLNEDLEHRVKERTKELLTTNQEMEAFTYSVSHDLRAPIRAIDGFSQIILEEYQESAAPEILRYLQVIRKNSHNMGQLVDDLLAFSRLGKQPVKKARVNINSLVKEVVADIKQANPKRDIEFKVGKMPPGDADAGLLRQVYVNLISNATKFTRGCEKAIIEIGIRPTRPLLPDGSYGQEVPCYYVQDNGVGFDMRYYGKLFGVFQRLHSSDEFEGTGVGLAIVQRVIDKHGGLVWAESKLGSGATFYFTLGEEKNDDKSN